jgi:hypothetical protein
LRVFTLVGRDGASLKCGGCNWRVDRLYVLADTAEEAVSLYREGEAGLCGDCFSSMLSEMEGLRIDGRGETIEV